MATPLTPFSQPPIQDLMNNGKLSTIWSGWFQQIWERLKGPIVSTITGSQTLATGIIFFPDEATLVSYVLPTRFNIGEVITIVGKGAGGWEVTQNTGQVINSPSGSTTVSSGSIASTNPYDSVVLIGTVKDTEFSIIGGQGTLTIT